jgi:hypothetical protein
MANYTIELGRLVQSGFKIFDFDYPFYNPDKRADFEELFVDRFYNYEICCETPTRWQRYLKTTMNTVFPYYNMLLQTAEIEYEKTKNYNITETQNREVDNTNKVTSLNTLTNNTSGSEQSSSTISNSGSSIDDSTKINILKSSTEHSDKDSIERTEKEVDDITNTLESTKGLDNTEVHSTTPKSMLSLEDLKSDIYASDATRQDNKETQKDTTKNQGTKTNTINETDNKTANDEVSANNSETLHSENSSTNAGLTTTGGTHSELNTANGTNTQDATGNTIEKFTRTMSGSYGVITEADMLQKHIALQSKLTTIYQSFFDECHSLFIQIWN